MTASIALNAEYAACDILLSSYGYEQTNVSFYKILRPIGKASVEMVRIGDDRVYTSHMAGQATPRPDAEIGSPIRARVNKWGSVIVPKRDRNAYKFDRQSAYFSEYA